jgi:hypothetical protein
LNTWLSLVVAAVDVAAAAAALVDIEPPLDLQYCPELRTQ